VNISLGVMEFDDGDAPQRVTSYVEKPTLTYDVSMGVYCFHPRVLEHLQAGVRLDFPDLILRLLAAGERVEAWRPEAYWLDLGRHDDYERAVTEFESMRERLLGNQP
jgi:NDP-sugar pyrophosphorylase family protein